MQRDVLLLTEMIDAAEQAQVLANGVSAEELAADRSIWPWHRTGASLC
jgi:hypothetical protein